MEWCGDQGQSNIASEWQSFQGNAIVPIPLQRLLYLSCNKNRIKNEGVIHTIRDEAYFTKIVLIFRKLDSLKYLLYETFPLILFKIHVIRNNIHNVILKNSIYYTLKFIKLSITFLIT